MSIPALSGVRVLELGEGVSAAFCAKLFADYGAEVLKVEQPGCGDVTRHWGPYPGDLPHPEKSGSYFCLNTNKQGITLDIASAAGQSLLKALLKDVDVLIENNAPARMKAWGLDYATLSALKPELIMISLTPYGQTGPYADWKGYDLNAFHLTGAGNRYCGRMGEPPLEQGTQAADYFGAYVAATWGLAAVFGVEQSGGEHIDVSCAEAVAALFVGGQNIGACAQNGYVGKRTGVGMPLAAPATILPCKDGHVWMLALEKGQWRGLVAAMGNPEWAQLDLFDDMFERAQNADLIYTMMDDWLRAHTKQEIMDLCQQHGCPSTAVYDIRDAATHPHLRERGYLVELEHPVIGRAVTLGAPVHLPDAPGGPRQAAPLLGQHNADVYRDRLGLSVADIAALERAGTI